MSLLITWVVAAPLVSALLIGTIRPLAGWVAAHQRFCLLAGWVGAAGLALGAATLSHRVSFVALMIGAPLVSFGLWHRRRSDGGNPPSDDGGGGTPPPTDPSPLGPVDWERFERDFWDHVGRRSQPREPIAG